MAEFFRYDKSDSGFTLLEVMIAVLLLSLSYVAVLESFSSSMLRLIKLEQRLESFFQQESRMSRDLKFTSPALDLDYTEVKGEIFVEGTTHQLSIATSEEGLLQSLQLTQK